MVVPVPVARSCAKRLSGAGVMVTTPGDDDDHVICVVVSPPDALRGVALTSAVRGMGESTKLVPVMSFPSLSIVRLAVALVTVTPKSAYMAGFTGFAAVIVAVPAPVAVMRPVCVTCATLASSVVRPYQNN